MTHEDYVSFEQAKALKELGFDWNCRQGWVLNCMKTWAYQPYPYFESVSNNDEYETILRPNLAQVQKWLREKEIEVAVYSEFDGELRTGQWVWLMRKFTTHLFDTVFSGDENLNYDTYEEALSAGISKAIEILKEQNNGK